MEQKINTIAVDKTTLSEAFTDIPGITMSQDVETGTDFYDVTGPNCHNRPAQVQSVILQVPNSRRITHLSQNEISGPAGWSYNPNGGYDIWYRLFDGNTKAEWQRKHTSHPVTYRVFVHWRSL